MAYFILKSRPDVGVVFCLNCRWWCAAVRRLSLRRTRSGGQCAPSARNSCHRRWCSGPFLSLRTRNDPSARRQQARTTTATITRTVRPCTECHYKRIFFFLKTHRHGKITSILIHYGVGGETRVEMYRPAIYCWCFLSWTIFSLFYRCFNREKTVKLFFQ